MFISIYNLLFELSVIPRFNFFEKIKLNNLSNIQIKSIFLTRVWQTQPLNY